MVKYKEPSNITILSLENRKGTVCRFSKEFKFCQEEPCGGCQVWLEWLKAQREK